MSTNGIRELARRKLRVPAIAFILFGVLGVLGGIIGCYWTIDGATTYGWRGYYSFYPAKLAIFLGVTMVFLLIGVGGICLLKLRRYVLVVVAACLMSAWVASGFFGILFYPFGIWALILLFQPDVRRAYRRASASQGTFNDIRDDYDENFGRVRTPIERARRKLIGPAIAFMLIGVVGAIGSLMGVAAITLEFYQTDDEELLVGLFFVVLALIGGALSVPIALGGWSMLKLRQLRLALVAAYIVTALSLCPLYAVPLVPFGIWALVLLYNPEIRQFFDLPELATPFAISPDSAGIRIPIKAYMIVGAIGLPLMLAICGWIFWDAFTSDYGWSDSELIWCVSLCLVGAVLAAVSIARGIYLKKHSTLEPPSATSIDLTPP